MFREKLETNIFSENIEVKMSQIPNAGLGCFAKKDFKRHEYIEVSPVLIFNRSIFRFYHDIVEHRHILHEYIFCWDVDNVAIAFGYGSIYNHASVEERNVIWSLNKTKEKESMIFIANKPIKKGEELLITYLADKKSEGLSFLDDATLLKPLI